MRIDIPARIERAIEREFQKIADELGLLDLDLDEQDAARLEQLWATKEQLIDAWREMAQ